MAAARRWSSLVARAERCVSLVHKEGQTTSDGNTCSGEEDTCTLMSVSRAAKNKTPQVIVGKSGPAVKGPAGSFGRTPACACRVRRTCGSRALRVA